MNVKWVALLEESGSRECIVAQIGYTQRLGRGLNGRSIKIHDVLKMGQQS